MAEENDIGPIPCVLEEKQITELNPPDNIKLENPPDIIQLETQPEERFINLTDAIYVTLPESIKKQYQTRLNNNKITSTFDLGCIQYKDEDEAKKAHAIILKVQASYIKKRELCRLKQKEQRDALKTLKKEPPAEVVEPPAEVVEPPAEVVEPKPIEIPPDLMDEYVPKINKQVKPTPTRKQLRPRNVIVEPTRKKSGVLDLFR